MTQKLSQDDRKTAFLPFLSHQLRLASGHECNNDRWTVEGGKKFDARTAALSELRVSMALLSMMIFDRAIRLSKHLR